MAERHARAELDLAHLASLSGEASTLATDALLASTPTAVPSAARAAFDLDRCIAASTLLRRWGPSSEAVERQATRDAAWRSWNAGEATAMRVIGERTRAVRRVQHETCLGRRARRT